MATKFWTKLAITRLV